MLGTGLGVTMPKMECKISLRSGDQDAWRRWVVNRNDVITAHGLDALMNNQLMPNMTVIEGRFPDLSSAEQQELLTETGKQYLSENTKLYFLIDELKDSVVISLGAVRAARHRLRWWRRRPWSRDWSPGHTDYRRLVWSQCV